MIEQRCYPNTRPNVTREPHPWDIMQRIATFAVLLVMSSSPAWSKTAHWTIDKIVDNKTRCPGTSGFFNPVLEYPAINGDWVVFLDGGNDGCAANDGPSIWSYNLKTQALTKLVDTDTEVPVPKGAGKFTGFNTGPTLNLQVNDGTVLFIGYDNGKNPTTNCSGGVYTVPAKGGVVHRVVDYTMTLPGQGGSFCVLQQANGTDGLQGMSLSAGTVVFSAQAVGNGYADDGVWSAPANVNTTEADITLVADSTTVYTPPWGGSTVYEWDGGFISGSDIAFEGGGGTGPAGLFLNSIADPLLLSNYVLPGDTHHNSSYPHHASNFTVPIVDGTTIYFVGSDPFYAGTCANGGGTGTFVGVYATTVSGGAATSILNTCDTQPNGDTLGANSFTQLAANDGTAVFMVEDGTTGDYVLDSATDGVVSELIAPGDALPSGASCSGAYHAVGCATYIAPVGTGGISAGHVIFGAEGGPYWYDDGIYLATLAK